MRTPPCFMRRITTIFVFKLLSLFDLIIFLYNILVLDFVFSQEECNKLQAVARTLKSDISILCDKLVRLSEKCMEFERENKSITVHHLNPYSLISPSALSGLCCSKLLMHFFSRLNDNIIPESKYISCSHILKLHACSQPTKNKKRGRPSWFSRLVLH